MDVMKPWITRRVTELLGFEDEVLINFIHGLLDAKVIHRYGICFSLNFDILVNVAVFIIFLKLLLS